MLAAIAEYEWVILMLLFLGMLGWELRRTRRDIRRAREKNASPSPPGRRLG